MAKPNTNAHSKEWYAARKRFFISLAIWLLALPVVALVQISTRFLLSGADDGAGNIIAAIINIVSLLVGVLSLFGWILPLIFGIMWSGKK